MQQSGSTSAKNSPSEGRDALRELVRVLARQAAREFATQGQAPADSEQFEPGDRK
jgi:hypothetical protein